MYISVLTDYELITRFQKQEEVFSLVCDDLVAFDSFYARTDGVWFGAYEGFTLIGTVFMQYYTSTTVEIHPILLKGHKHKFLAFSKILFDMIFSGNIKKINAVCPVIYPSNRNACKRVGFKDEGISRGSYLKGGILHDAYHLGLTKEDYYG